jgi:hypothetical protein
MIQNVLNKTALREIINKSYFELNSLFLSNQEDISEYDVQHIFYTALKERLKNKSYIVKKERQKIDVSVTNYEETFKYYFEVKSFIKSKELISLKSIESDINKMKGCLLKQKGVDKRAFIVLAINQKKLTIKKKSRNCNLLEYLNHSKKKFPLENMDKFKYSLTSSFSVANNIAIQRTNVIKQVRLFLIEIK